MKRLLLFLSLVVFIAAAHADPLRVFIRGGKKTHGPNQHEHEKFLADWKVLLAERGMKADGALDWPTAEQMKNTDVIIVHAQSGGDATDEQKANLAEFVKRGGGLVVIHAAAVAKDPAWWKSIVGGAWVQKQTKFKEGEMDLYFTENQFIGGGHPITKGASNFHLDDEIYYDMDLSPDIRVLATAYTPKVKEGKKAAEGGKANIYDIQPQMWIYERTAEGGAQPYRAVVSIPGHLYDTFGMPNYRAILLRSIAWAGKRANLDEFSKPEEIAALTYPPGGPQRPADTLKALEIHPDFTLKLVASEPLINKPMNFDWAPDGSLWVAETPEYPNGRRGMRPDYRGTEWKDHGGIDPTPGEQERKAQDKISRLIDTDGDGVMDKKEIFYEGLELVTGLVFYKDGVIVTQAPDILWLRDTDGDGKADKVEKLYTGLGTRDTHAVINNPRWGWDGWIYATHGYSGSSEVKNAKGELQGTIGSGVVRFRPDGSKIEQYSSKGGNTWGLEITGENRVMWTQPTSGTVLNHTVLPESVLALGKLGATTSFKNVIASPKTFPAMSWDQQAYRQIDHVGDFTAAAGCVIYDGGSWPAEYNGDYFTTEPTINIVHHSRLKPEGSSYTGYKLPGREEMEFIRSKDMWFRPIEVRVGPDGAVYIGDFYNQAVIHNDTRGPDHNKVNAAVRPDRDHYFGRIWRLDHKAAQKLAVPDLSKAGVADLAKALEHPNRAIRMTASRLLNERPAPPAANIGASGLLPDAVNRANIAAGVEARRSALEKAYGFSALEKLVADKTKPAETRIATLWTYARCCPETPSVFTAALRDDNAEIRRNAALVAEIVTAPEIVEGLERMVGDSDAQVRVAALRAIAAGEVGETAAKAIIGAWSKFDDDFQKSAAIAATAGKPVPGIAAALESSDPAPLAPLVSQLAQKICDSGDSPSATQLVIALADKPASADALKRSILDGFARNMKDAPPMSPQLSAALGKLLASGVSSSVLPLAARWDKAGALKSEIAKLTTGLFDTLANARGADEARLTAAQSLLGLRSTNGEIVPAVIAQLGKDGSASFKRALIAALGETDDANVGTALSAAYGKLSADVQPAAFDAVLKRADWTNAFLDAVKAKQIDPATLGPASAFRLRSHPDKAVAKRATAMLDELNPTAKLKKDAIAKLLPIAEQKGDAEHGKQLFATTCAICHNFHGAGADIGPQLTGMGAHGAAELLAAIVDPNAEVEPSFTQWNIETKDGRAFAGVIAAENPASITLKSLAGVQEVKTADIKSRVNTGRSLMPEGLEGLGGEALRDIITYFQSADGGKFRLVDLRDAFTATTSAGLYNSQEAKRDSLEFAKTGNVTVTGMNGSKVPFNIVSPDKAPLNVIVLKGGPEKSFSHSLPARVEAKLGGFTANRLHFLGGIAGWGSKGNRSPSDLVKLTVQYGDGQKESLVFRDGVEFADYIGPIDVPGSKLAEGLVKTHQLRVFSKQLARTAPIDKLTFESLDDKAAATFVAITAELADANAAPLAAASAEPPQPGIHGGTLVVEKGAGEDASFKPQFDDPVPQPPAKAEAIKGPRVLLVGGGSSHDFVKYFGATDKATLAPHVGWVDFTQNANGVAPILKDIDVLVWSANQPVSSATCQALLDFANAGKGIVALHPGTWYAWKNFPDWNLQIVGGGTRGHDALGPYTVTVTKPASPITKGLPASFEITDELYNYAADPTGTPIEVLATATSPKSGKTFPQVFVVKHPKSRIVGITLGHDARAHDLPEFQTLLKNAVNWAAGK